MQSTDLVGSAVSCHFSISAAGHAPQHPSTTATLCMIWRGTGSTRFSIQRANDIIIQIRKSCVAFFEPVHGELPVCMERSHQVHGGAHTYQTAGHNFLMDDGEVSTCGRHDTAKAPPKLQVVNEDFPQILPGVPRNMEA